MNLTLLDCTLRDGGYYNAWDFSPQLINRYLAAMKAAQIDVVELGFRFINDEGFKGACAFTTDDFLRRIDIPPGLMIGVMVNCADLSSCIGWQAVLEYLFPETSDSTPLDLVRLACHFHELQHALSAASWLTDRGYRVGLNLMQITGCTQFEVEKLAELASASSIEVLYFADSLGSMTPEDVSNIVGWLRTHWSGPLGIHTHDNMRLALANTLRAQAEGVNWVDSTITGMGRGPGNARTEELVVELEALHGKKVNILPMMALIRSYFGPMKIKHGWGTNPYYYLAGKYGIHPSYVQEMLSDLRYEEEDILAVLEHLREVGGKRFSYETLYRALRFYYDEPHGTWSPATIMKDRDVLVLGSGPGVVAHRAAIESYIRSAKPIVLALNTQSEIDSNLIDLRVACHPVRLLADAAIHCRLPQPLIAPVSMLPKALRAEFKEKEILDFGLGVEDGMFSFHETYCKTPSPLVLAYALAVVTSGMATRILMTGFDGYVSGDPRNDEIEGLLNMFIETNSVREIYSLTPTKYKSLPVRSIYAA